MSDAIQGGDYVMDAPVLVVVTRRIKARPTRCSQRIYDAIRDFDSYLGSHILR